MDGTFGEKTESMFKTHTLLGSIGLLVLVACGGGEENGSPPPEETKPAPTNEPGENAPPTPPGVTDFAIASSGGPLVLRAKTPLAFDVAIERKSGFAGDVFVEIGMLPPGVTADIMQPGAGNVAKIALTFGAAAMLGDYEIEIVARANDVTRTAKRALIVAGYVGTLDEAFGVSGVVTLPKDARALEIHLDSAGRTVVAGNDKAAKTPFFARYSTIGKPETWSPDGAKRMALSSDSETSYLYDMAVAPSGIFLVGSGTTSMNVTRACVLKLTEAGEKDLAWGDGGSRCFNSGATDVAGRLTVLSDGALIVAGITDNTDLTVTKLTPTGDLDTSFAGTGTKRIERVGLQQPFAVATDSKGRILLDALCWDVSSACVFRLDQNGELDATFKGGVAFPKVDTAEGIFGAMVIGPNDEIYLAGESKTHTAFTALDPAGGPLQTFGTNGWRTEKFGSSSSFYSLVLDGERLVSGGAIWAAAEVKLTALDLAGAVDPSLPSAGFPSVVGVNGELQAMAISPARATMIIDVATISKIHRVWR